MAKQFKLTITSPDGKLFEREVDQVTVPTATGEITILPNHAPLVSKMASGEVLLKFDEDVLPIAVAGGFLQIKHNQVTVLADYAQTVEGLTEEKIAAAKERAETIRDQKDKVSNEEFEFFEGELERALALAKVHGKWKDKSYKKLSI